MTVRRVDFVGRLDGKARTSQGFVRLDANLTRSGVFEYRDSANNVIREYRPPEEVFNNDSLETLKLAPLTIGHPNGVVTPANVRSLRVGGVAEGVRRDSEFVRAPVIVEDADAIAAVDSGELVELSCGYDVDIDPTPGRTDAGEAYDCIQRNIRYNHVGLGPKDWGRAGSEVRLHLDGKGSVVLPSYPRTTMTLEEAIKALEAEKKRADGLEAERDTLKVDLGKEKARADAASASTKTGGSSAGNTDPEIDRSKIDALVAARVQLQDSARVVLGAEYKFTKEDGKPVSDEDIVRAVIAKHEPAFKCDGRSTEYLRSRFDSIVERAARVDAAHADLNEASGKPEGKDGGAQKSRADEAAAKLEADAKATYANAPPAGALVRK